MIADILCQICLVYATLSMYVGKPMDIKENIMKGLQKFCIVFIASNMAALILIPCFVILVIPGVYVAVRLFAIVPILIVENAGVVGSFKRSFALIEDNWCYALYAISRRLQSLYKPNTALRKTTRKIQHPWNEKYHPIDLTSQQIKGKNYME